MFGLGKNFIISAMHFQGCVPNENAKIKIHWGAARPCADLVATRPHSRSAELPRSGRFMYLISHRAFCCLRLLAPLDGFPSLPPGSGFPARSEAKGISGPVPKKVKEKKYKAIWKKGGLPTVQIKCNLYLFGDELKGESGVLPPGIKT